jgi:transposase
MKSVSKALQIGIGTVHRWLKGNTKHRLSTVGRRKFTDSMCDFVKFKVSQIPHITQIDLLKEIVSVYQVKISRQCLSNVFKRLGITRKRLKHRTRCNEDDLSNKRQLFKNKWNNTNIQNIISIDEVGFGDSCLPIYGYSYKGQPAFVKRHATQRKRLNVIMAIDSKQNLFYKYFYGNVNSTMFEKFITDLPWTGTKTIVMDNASIHKTNNIKSVCLQKQYDIQYIPPYTPEFNPIEYVFSSVKNSYRKISATTNNYEPHQLFESIINKINKTIISNCFNHVINLVNV